MVDIAPLEAEHACIGGAESLRSKNEWEEPESKVSFE